MSDKTIKLTLEKLLKVPAENEWLEFKQARTSFSFEDLGKYFSALSNEANLHNRDKGWLILGVSNRREVTGTTWKSSAESLNRVKHDVCVHTTGGLTFIEIHEVLVDGKRVLLFEIPAASRGVPTPWKGHYYGRAGESIVPLSDHKHDEIRNQLRISDWSASPCDGARLSDLDKSAIDAAKVEFVRKNPRLESEVQDWDDLQFLTKIKLCIHDKITNAAIVLLGKSETNSLLSPATAQITWIVQDEAGNEKDYEHFGPPLFLNVTKIFDKIRNLKYRYLPDSSLFPVEISQYEPWVIREALHNCIAHQDYLLASRILVVERVDELLFINAGDFIPGSVENVIMDDAPPLRYRNKQLADSMYSLNMIDTVGSGIKRMFKVQCSRNFPLPDYDLHDSKQVRLKILGRILDPNYTKVLMEHSDLDLQTVMLLDRVQKRVPISKEEHRQLKRLGLVEGRYPGISISSQVAQLTGTRSDKTAYIRNRAFDDQYYRDLILKFLRKFGQATRTEINDLLVKKLPDILTAEQKRNKVSNLLGYLARSDEIKNVGSKRKPKWVLSQETE